MAGKLFAKHVVRKVFLEDWGSKLIALVITLGLWLGVTGLSTPTTRRLAVPLSIYISNNAEITNAPVQEVEVVITGDKGRIDQINRADLTASLDLTDVLPGDRVISLSPANITVPLPQGVKLIEVTPSRIPVNLEAVAENEMPVRAETIGAPATGSEVYTITVLPPKVRVRGPASVIKTLEYVQADRIDINGKKDDITAKQVAVSVANPKAAVLNPVVDVYIRIGERRVERPFTVPVSGFPGKTASFVLYGPRTQLAKTKPDAFKVEMVLDVGGQEIPQVTLPPELQDVAEIRKLKLN